MASKRDLLRQANRPAANNNKKKEEAPAKKSAGNLVDELIEDISESAEPEAPAEMPEETPEVVAVPAQSDELSFDIPTGADKRTSIIIQDVNINYMNYIVAIHKTNRQNYLSALIYREMQKDGDSGDSGIPDFSRPVRKKKLPATKVSQQGIIIYTYAWEYAQQKADLLRETVSVYIDDLLTAEREKFMQTHH